MTAYASSDDVFKRYPMVSNIVGSGTNLVASADVNSIYISDAMSIVDAYMSRRYVTPLTPEPIVTMVTADIAIYRMFEDKLARFPDAIEKRYTNALSLITMLTTGLMNLTSTNLVTSGGDQDAWTTATSNAGVIFQPAEAITNIRSIFDPFFELDRRSF